MALRIALLSLNSSQEKWVKDAISYYETKLSRFCEFEKLELKPYSSSRDDAEEKKQKDSEILLRKINPDDFVILCDEKGRAFDSLKFSSEWQKMIELSRRRYVFVLGGPYGSSEELTKRANLLLSLSPMTMNHWVAEVMMLEQLYRAFTIIRKIPYHNV
jgi:23S rRNA (pseudouridine1915-N3)-methyltransferase